MTISCAEAITGGGGAPAPAQTFAGSVAVGHVLVAKVLLIGNPFTVTVSDNTNAGNYLPVAGFYDSPNGWWFSIHAKQATSSAAAGTCTVTATQGDVQFGNVDIERYTGFTGTMTVDPTLAVLFTGSTSSIGCSPIATAHPNTVLAALMHGAAGLNTEPSGWTVNADARSYFAIETASGTTNNFMATLNATTPWSALFGAIYDSPANTAAVAWLRA